MPRRKGPTVSRHKNIRKGGAPKPIKIVAPQINVAELMQAYEWFAVSNILAFKLAFEWYSKSVPALLFGDPLDESRQKAYDRATKSKNIGDSTDYAEEKITAWTTAVKLYEKVWATRSLPKLDEYVTKTELSEQVRNTQTVLTALNAAFNGTVVFRMTLNAEREFDHGEILLPQAELQRMVPMTPLKIALNEVPTVAKVVSIDEDEEGNQSLNGEKFMSTLPMLLSNVADWATADRSTGKAIGKAIRQPKAASAGSTATTPRAPRTPSTVKVKGNMTITVINANAVPRVTGKRKDALELGLKSPNVADLKAALAALGGRMETYVGYVVKTLVDAGAISVS